MNVYGYGLCNNTAAVMLGLSRYAGFKVQGWSVHGHVIPELWYDDGWRYFDPSFIEYFPKADGSLAGVEEIFAAVKEWYDKNPDFMGNRPKLQEFSRNGGWKNGPEIMSRCPLYDERNGNLPAKTHGWYSTMRRFDGTVKTQGYESGVSNGYRVNIQLRPGEKLVRNWSNKGLHINMLPDNGGRAPNCLTRKVGEQDLVYTPKWGDLAPGRVGNGTLEYNPVSAGMDISTMAKEADGSFVVRMPSSYVYLTGKLEMDVDLEAGKTMAIAFSDNNGLDWKPLATIEKSGSQSVDLQDKVGRRYDYQLKFSPQGKATFKAFKITHDVQHSQRALPALDKGENKITFSVGPQESTVTIEPSTNAANAGKQLTVSDFRMVLDNVTNEKPGLHMAAGKGSITVPVTTPGDMTALRMGTMYRARDKNDIWTLEASFDDGKTWKQIKDLPGDTRITGDYTVMTDIPVGTRSALIRWSGTQRSTLLIFNLRLDADYKAPGAGFAPVKVTYVWDEDGQEKRHEHIASNPQDSWTITCASKPVMKSITLELAK